MKIVLGLIIFTFFVSGFSCVVAQEVELETNNEISKHKEAISSGAAASVGQTEQEFEFKPCEGSGEIKIPACKIEDLLKENPGNRVKKEAIPVPDGEK